MYQLTISSSVRRADGTVIPADLANMDYREYLQWLEAGNTPEAAPGPVFEDRQRLLQAAVQHHMDARAQAMGYDDIKTAVTYAEEPAVSRFQLEGRALRAWRSMVWARCYELLAEVVSGARAEPAAEEIVGLLPAWVEPEVDHA